MIRRFSFGDTAFRVNTALPYAQTVFADGAVCPAIPNEGEDLATFYWHDFAHSFVCWRLGLPHSPTLWAVAHEEEAGLPHWAEEGLVNEFVAFLKDANHFHPVLSWLFIAGKAEEWREAALAMLEGGVTDG